MKSGRPSLSPLPQQPEVEHEELTEPIQSVTRQEELIGRHCSGIDPLIRQAKSLENALEIIKAKCASFEEECPSSILQNALEEAAHRILRKYWSQARPQENAD